MGVTASGTLADFETLLPDSRVERLRDAVAKAFPKLPEDFQLATYIQPSRLVPRPGGSGELVQIGERAVFLMVSPNPHPRYKGQMLKTQASMRMKLWREEEAEAAHFVSGADPALKFFRRMAREHIVARTNWTELN